MKSINLLKACKETIISVYEEKTGLPTNKIDELMTAETWFTAEEALENGFVDSIKDEVAVKNSFVLSSVYKNAPQEACVANEQAVTMELIEPKLEVEAVSEPAVENKTYSPEDLAAAVEAKLSELAVAKQKKELSDMLTGLRLEAVENSVLTPASAEALEASFSKQLEASASLAELEALQERIEAAYSPAETVAVAQEAVTTPVAMKEEKNAMEFNFDGIIPAGYEPQSYIGDKFAQHLVNVGRAKDYAEACNLLYTDSQLKAKWAELSKQTEQRSGK